MKFIEKMEELLNGLLLKVGAFFVSLWMKVRPHWFVRFSSTLGGLCAYLKALCLAPMEKFHAWKTAPKDFKIDYKGLLTQAIQASKEAYAKSKEHSPLTAFLRAVGAPFAFLYRWAASLSPSQFLLLTTFSLASFLSVVGIAINSSRILNKNDATRAPASVSEDEYNRPAYHKRDKREFTVTNVKLPVYVEGVAELKALLIDFTATATNRSLRNWMDKHEFQLRDHLLLTLEPVLPAFPLTDEGRVMLSDKLRDEINIFIQQSSPEEGRITDVRLIHILTY